MIIYYFFLQPSSARIFEPTEDMEGNKENSQHISSDDTDNESKNSPDTTSCPDEGNDAAPETK